MKHIQKGLALLPALFLFACAQPGYHYEPFSFVQTPNSACQDRAVTSAGAVQWVNTVPGIKPVVRISQASGTGQGSNLSCHVVLTHSDGTSEGGQLDINDHGPLKPLQVTWNSDAARAAQEEYDLRHPRRIPSLGDLQVCGLIANAKTSVNAATPQGRDFLESEMITAARRRIIVDGATAATRLEQILVQLVRDNDGRHGGDFSAVYNDCLHDQ